MRLTYVLLFIILVSSMAFAGGWKYPAYNTGHTHANPNDGPSGNYMLWSTNVSAGTPLVDGGLVFLAEYPQGGLSLVSAYNATTGEAVWSVSCGEYPWGTKVFAADGGQLYAVCAYDDPDYGYTPHILAFNETSGGVRWNSSVSTTSGWPEWIDDLAIGADGVYVVGDELHRLDAATGNVENDYQCTDWCDRWMLVQNDIIYTGEDAQLTQLNGSLEKNWQIQLGDDNHIRYRFADSGVVYLGGYDYGQDAYFLDAVLDDGTMAWNTTLNMTYVGAMALSDGKIYFYGADADGNAFFVMNATDGNQIARYPETGILNNVLNLGGGLVYTIVNSPDTDWNNFQFGDMRVAAYNTSGFGKIWDYPANKYIYSPPVIANGVAYANLGNGVAALTTPAPGTIEVQGVRAVPNDYVWENRPTEIWGNVFADNITKASVGVVNGTSVVLEYENTTATAGWNTQAWSAEAYHTSPASTSTVFSNGNELVVRGKFSYDGSQWQSAEMVFNSSTLELIGVRDGGWLNVTDGSEFQVSSLVFNDGLGNDTTEQLNEVLQLYAIPNDSNPRLVKTGLPDGHYPAFMGVEAAGGWARGWTTVGVNRTLPDFTVGPVTFGSNDIYTNDIVDVNATISNIGDRETASVDGELVVNFYEGNPEDGDLVDSEIVTAPLPPNSSRIVRGRWRVHGSGNVSMYVVVDSDNQIYEKNESNNVAMETASVNASTYDFRIDDGDMRVSNNNPPQDADITVNVTVHNVGTRDYNYSQIDPDYTGGIIPGSPYECQIEYDGQEINYWSKARWAGCPAEIGVVGGNTQELPLFIGKNGSAEVTSGYHVYSEPNTTEAITAIADPGDVYAEPNETNNNGTINITVSPYTPDFVISAPVLNNPSPYEGDWTTINATLTNVGGLNFSSDAYGGGMYVSFYLDNENNIIREVYVTSANVGEDVPVEIDYNFGEDAGNHTLFVKADMHNQVTESNESNNLNSTNMVVQKRDYDFAVTNVTPEDYSPFEGKKVLINATVANYGSDNLTGDLYVLANLGSPDGPPVAWGWTNELPAGGNRIIQLSWDTTGQSGNETLYIVADSNHLYTEPDENNNVMPVNVTVGPGKDIDFALSDSEIWVVPDNAHPGDDVNITATVHNLGTDDFNTSEFGKDLGATIEIDGGSWGSYEEEVFIPANGSANVSVMWNLGNLDGPYNISMHVNEYRSIPETNYDNNIATTNITVTPDPLDLVASNIYVDGHYREDELAALTLEVSNPTNYSCNGGFEVYFYDGKPEDGKLIANTWVDGLGAGEVVNVTDNWVVEGEAGSHDIYGVVDYPNAVTETNESNNQLNKSTYVDGYVWKFVDNEYEKTVQVAPAVNGTVYFLIPKAATIVNASMYVWGEQYIGSAEPYNKTSSGGNTTFYYNISHPVHDIHMSYVSSDSCKRWWGVWDFNSSSWCGEQNGKAISPTTTKTRAVKHGNKKTVTIRQEPVLMAAIGKPKCLFVYTLPEFNLSSTSCTSVQNYLNQNNELIGTFPADGNATVYWYSNPANVTVNVAGGADDWSHSGTFGGGETITGFEGDLSSWLANCTADTDGYCQVPIEVSSDDYGVMHFENLQINYTV